MEVSILGEDAKGYNVALPTHSRRAAKVGADGMLPITNAFLKNAKTIFNQLRGNKVDLVVEDLLHPDLQDTLSKSEFKNILRQAGIIVEPSHVSDVVTEKQFIQLLASIRSARRLKTVRQRTAEMKMINKQADTTTEMDTNTSLEELYDNLRGDAEQLALPDFFEWEPIARLVSTQMLSADELDGLVEEVGLKKGSSVISFSQFNELLVKIDAAVFKDEPADLDEDWMDATDAPVKLLSDKEVEDIRAIYENLQDEQGKVTAQRVKGWKDVVELISSDALKESTVDSILSAMLNEPVNKRNADSLTLSLEQFGAFSCTIIRLVSQPKRFPGTQGEKSKKPAHLNEEGLRTVYERLKGTDQVLSAETLMQWKDLTEMLSSGTLCKLDVMFGITQNVWHLMTDKYGPFMLGGFDEFRHFVNKMADCLDVGMPVRLRWYSHRFYETLKDNQNMISLRRLKAWKLTRLFIERFSEPFVNAKIAEIVGEAVPDNYLDASSVYINSDQFHTYFTDLYNLNTKRNEDALDFYSELKQEDDSLSLGKMLKLMVFPDGKQLTEDDLTKLLAEACVERPSLSLEQFATLLHCPHGCTLDGEQFGPRDFLKLWIVEPNLPRITLTLQALERGMATDLGALTQSWRDGTCNITVRMAKRYEDLPGINSLRRHPRP